MSLQIGQYIKYALGEVNAPLLNAKVKGRVSPVVSPDDDGTHMPYIWYYSDGFTPSNTKDGEYEDTCSVSIEVVASSYEQLIDLLILVKKAMDDGYSLWNTTERPFDVVEQHYTAGPEEYDDQLQAYCRKLNFSIITYEKIH